MKTFIRVTEVWTPNHDGSQLELGSGSYSKLTSLRDLSVDMTFAYDEGLPGKAWACGHPIILKQLEGSYFKRAEAAQRLGLTCGIAIPIFAGDFIKGVVVFLCGEDDLHVGAIELWCNTHADSSQMNLHDGYYGSAEMFEWLSSKTSFRKGEGLPGLAWQDNLPILLSDLTQENLFARRAGVAQIGLQKGIALPFTAGKHTYVITLLSSRLTPIARRIEIWRPDAARDCLVFAAGECDDVAGFDRAYSQLGIARGDGVIGRVWISGTPLVSRVTVPLPSVADLNAESAGLHTVVVIPLIGDGQLTSIIAWYF